jgi:glycerol transport system substrate-binding protein
LIEFYRSEERKKWTDTGPNVPDYPTLSALWWPNIARAIEREVSPQQAMDTIAQAMDEAMGQMRIARYSPDLDTPYGHVFWLSQPGAPKPERPRPQPQTIAYDQLLKLWIEQSEEQK